MNLESGLAVVEGDAHIGPLAQQAFHFAHRLGRKDQMPCVFLGHFQFFRNNGKSPSIRGGKGERAVSKIEKHAIHDVACFVRRLGVRNTLEHPRQLILPKHKAVLVVKRRQWWKLVRADPHDPEE